MVSNKKLSVLVKKWWFPVAALVLIGCANMQRPQGGPRDLTPPKLLKATPENMTRNFKAKQIELEFDEFYKLTNQYQEISISPAQEKLPEYKVRKKNLIIEFKDSLQKNTTYVINFGKAIVDVNEANAVKNFTYVFSTGPHIDSLSISGTVTNSTTQQKEKDATVLLFPINKDTAFYKKKKPSIFASTDSSGNFSLNNLAEGKYRVYALKETAPNKIYDNETEMVAFIRDTINLTTDTSNIQLNLFVQEPENFRFIERRFDTDGRILMTFNRRLVNPSINIITPAALNSQKIVEFGTRKDTAQVFMRNMDFDSLKISIAENNKPIDTIVLRKNRKENFQKDVKTDLNIGANKLKPGTDLILTTSVPVNEFNPAYFTLKEDSAVVSNFNIIRDTAATRKLIFKYRWKQNVTYELTMNEGAITTIFGTKNKKGIVKFTVDKPENYSVLTLKLTVPEPNKSYVVELMKDEKNVLRTDVITKNASLVYSNYITGKYRIRVTYDANKNGRWDSGNIRQKRQPENMWLYDKEITLRPNWEAEEAIVIPKEPATP